MLSSIHFLRNLDFWSVLLRMVLSCACGAAIGLERFYKNRPAGFRTHILVCMGSAVAALTGLYMYMSLDLPSDIARISGQVISGLGFIGAGTIIITQKQTIVGLTTAAGLWATGIIGLAIGSGYYEIGVAATVLVLMTEVWFGRLGKYIHRTPFYNIEVQYSEKTSLDSVLRFCKDHHMSIIKLKVLTHPLVTQGSAKYIASLSLRGNTHCDELLREIKSMPGIVQAEEEEE